MMGSVGTRTFGKLSLSVMCLGSMGPKVQLLKLVKPCTQDIFRTTP